MTLGADRKKAAIFGGLIVVLLIVAYFQFFSSSGPADEPRPAAGNRAAAADIDARPAAPPSSARPQLPDIGRAAPLRSGGNKSESGSSSSEFRPTVEHQNLDPMKADPILHTDKLAKVQAVALAGGERNLFQFGTAPPPKPIIPEVKKIIPGTPGLPGVPKDGSKPSPTDSAKAADPPLPPIPLKFYGFTEKARQSNRRAFFLCGEEIIVAGEGDVVIKKYKVVRIGLNSVVMEDQDTKKQQPLPLEEQPG